MTLLAPLASSAQVTNLNLGNLAPGETITVTYEVTVNNTLPPTLQGITNQAAVSGTGIATVNSDDPDTGALNDPTVTPLVQVALVETRPATFVTADGATLNALVWPGGDAAGYYFEIATNVFFDSSTITNTLPANFTTSSVSIAVSGLLPNKVYHYRVRATNSLGLVGGSSLSFTTTVFAITAQPVSVGACVGNTASFSVSVNAPGSATYQWQRRDPGAGFGEFNNINGATSALYQTPPVSGADDGATYRVIVSAPGTNITSSDGVLAVIETSAPDKVVYDFKFGPPTNTALYGSAFVTNEVLVLTTNGGGQVGGFLTADFAPGRLVRGFTATFKLRIYQGSGTPADGFSFNWGADVPGAAVGEEGAGSGLSVCFDTYDNGLGEAPAIDVKWNSNVVSHTAVPLSFISDFSGSFRTASIRLNTDGTIDIIYNCTPVLTRFPIPGYTPQLNSRFLLSARTGGEFAAHSVDDLAIQLNIDPTNGLPRITRQITNGFGGMVIFGTGETGRTYGVQASTDFTNWVSRGSVTTAGDGSWSYFEPNISTPPYRFYRLIAAPQFPGGLIDWWRADGNFVDTIGGFDGTPVNNLGFTNGQRGLAFNFDGTNHQMHIGSSSIVPPWTACFWVKRQDAAGGSAALITSSGSGLKLEQGGTPRQVGFTAFNVADYSFTYSAPTNVWTHLAFVGTSSNTVLYANGTAVGTNANSISLPRFTIGARETGLDRMKGQLDETALFNRALTPAEIQQVINATRGP